MKVQKEMYVHCDRKYDGSDDWSLFSCDMSAYGHVCAGKTLVEFEVPDNYNPVRQQIEMLQKEQERVTNEFNDRVQKIKEEISKLQCLEMA